MDLGQETDDRTLGRKGRSPFWLFGEKGDRTLGQKGDFFTHSEQRNRVFTEFAGYGKVFS
jgi:hypothetical protein